MAAAVDFAALQFLFSGSLGCFWSCVGLCVGGGRIYYLRRTSDFFKGLNAFFPPLCLHIIKLIIA